MTYLSSDSGGGGGSSINMGASVVGGTPGSVLFVGAGPTLAQDNTNLFWDNTNKRLGIGINTPSEVLEVRGSGSAGRLAMSAGGVNTTRMYNEILANQTGYIGINRNSGGTYSTPTFTSAVQTYVCSTTNSNIAFYLTTTPNDVNPPERMRISGNGFVSIGTAAALARLAVIDTIEQLRLLYDGVNYMSTSVASNGSTTFSLTGTTPTFIFSHLISAPSLNLSKTITPAGTTGNRTINNSTGSVNFAAAATSLVVTNSLVTTSSVIQATVATNDTTMYSVQAVAAAGSFTLYANAAPTAETRVNFTVTN